MKIELETKFNVGDEVYVADFCYDCFYTSQIPYKISTVTITIDGSVTNITYLVIANGWSETVAEHWIFHTKEECDQWCKQKNERGYGK